jgi:hypothetical protein
MTPEGEALLAETPKLRRWFESMSGRQTVIHTAPQLG